MSKENIRYNEIDSKDITSMDDIDRIVSNELMLDKDRNKNLKSGMRTAKAVSGMSKFIISITIAIMSLIIVFISYLALSYLHKSYQKFGTIPNTFNLSEYLKKQHNMKEDDFLIETSKINKRSNSGEYILTPKWNPELKFTLLVKGYDKSRRELPDYDKSVFNYYINKYNNENNRNFIQYKEIYVSENDVNIQEEIDKRANETDLFLKYLRINKDSTYNDKYKYRSSLRLLDYNEKELFNKNIEISIDDNFESIKSKLTGKENE